MATSYRVLPWRINTVAVVKEWGAYWRKAIVSYSNWTIQQFLFFVSIVKTIINIDELLVGGAVMRRLNDGKGSKDGKEGNMYQHLGSDEQERQSKLALFKNWVGSWDLKRWADIFKDEFNSVKARY